MERVTAACVAAANAQGNARGMQWTAVTAVIDTPGAPHIPRGVLLDQR
jgi:hypothetical protein